MLEINELEKQSTDRKPPSLWNPLSTIQRCWKWALPTGIVLAAIAAFATWQTYEATYRAVHLLEGSHNYLVFADVNPAIKDLATSEKDFLLNPIVLDAVLADSDLRTAPSLADPESAAENLLKGLSIESAGTASRMVVSYQDTDPQAAAKVCNAVVASYLKRRSEFDAKRANNLQRWIEPEIQSWELEVEKRQLRTKQLSRALIGHAPGDLAEAERKSDMQFIMRLRSQITETAVEIAVLDAQLELNVPGDAEKSGQENTAPDATLAQSEKTMRRRRDLLSAKLEVFENKYDEEKHRLEQYGDNLAELQFAQAEMSVASEVLGKLRSRVAAIRTERSQVTSVRSLAPATVPREPINPPPFGRMAFAGAAGFCLPWLLGFIVGFWPQPVYTQANIE